MFGKIQSEKKFVYIFGDFNMNSMSNTIGNANAQEFKNIFSSNYCLPLITKPTRVTHLCASIIFIAMCLLIQANVIMVF